MHLDMKSELYTADVLELTTCLGDVRHSALSCSTDRISISHDAKDKVFSSMDFPSGQAQSHTSAPSSSPSTLSSDAFSPTLSPAEEVDDQDHAKIFVPVWHTQTQTHNHTQVQAKPRYRKISTWTNLGLETFADSEKTRHMSLDEISAVGGGVGADKQECHACGVVAVEESKRKVERRRVQNRAAQRNYRMRQQAQLHEASRRAAILQSQVDSLLTRVDHLEFQNEELQARNAYLECGQLVPDSVQVEWDLGLSRP